MKQGIHPATHPVVFVDSSCGAEFVTTSTLTSDEKRDINGVSHFVIHTEISSGSHPFYTGKQILLDTARRVEKFEARMQKQAAAAEKRKGKKAKQAARAADKQEEATEAPKAEVKTEVKEAAPVEDAPAVEEKTEEAEA